MIIRFSIQDKEEKELYVYEIGKYREIMIDNEPISQFMEAFSRTKWSDPNSINQIIVSNMILYVKIYENFSVRMLANHEMNENELTKFFEEINEETQKIFSSPTTQRTFEIFQEKIKPIITQIFHDPISEKWREDSFSGSRIALVGLANAGKTTIRKIFFDSWTKEMAKNVRATKGIDMSRSFHDFIEHRITILDFGGQTIYRKDHLSKEDIWKELSALIYIVDIQDSSSYESAQIYLNQIWEIVSQVNKKIPKLSIFFHKYDKSKRMDLKDSMKNCLDQFSHFRSNVSYHLTTFEDESSNIAMLKTLYFSIPEIILPRLLETQSMGFFENIMLKRFSKSYSTKAIEGQKEKEKWVKWAETIGLNCGLNFQKSWFNSIEGDRPITSIMNRPIPDSFKILEENGTIEIRMSNLIYQQYSVKIWKELFDGFLAGLLKTFLISPPIVVEEINQHTHWKINL